MVRPSTTLNEEFVAQVRELAQAVENGDEKEADRLLDQLAKVRESSLFQELGKLTRQFHESLNNFRLDARISQYAEKDFPDARKRLRYVVSMTGQSADRSLTAAEKSMPICESIHERADNFIPRWERFVRRDMNASEFRDLSNDLNSFFTDLGNHSTELKGNLNEVILAQDFQDLTGQIIERVIRLVDDMEDSLVELVRLSGQNLIAAEELKKGGVDEDAIKAVGPSVPGVDDASKLVSGQDEVDDLLSSLGF